MADELTAANAPSPLLHSPPMPSWWSPAREALYEKVKEGYLAKGKHPPLADVKSIAAATANKRFGTQAEEKGRKKP